MRPDPRPSPSASLRDAVAFDEGAPRICGVAVRVNQTSRLRW
jgi:hypothetical protein